MISQHKRDAAAKLEFDPGVATSKKAEELAPVSDLSKMSAADLLVLLQQLNLNAKQERQKGQKSVLAGL